MTNENKVLTLVEVTEVDGEMVVSRRIPASQVPKDVLMYANTGMKQPMLALLEETLGADTDGDVPNLHVVDLDVYRQSKMEESTECQVCGTDIEQGDCFCKKCLHEMNTTI